MPTITATQAGGNPQLQTVKRALPQTTEAAPQAAAPFIRLVKKMVTPGFLASFPADGVTHTPSTTLPAAPGFVRALSLLVSITGGTGTGTTYQPDAPYSYINSVQFRDINNTVIFQLTGFELYLVNLFSGQAGDNGFQNPAALSSFKAGDAAGNILFRLVIPFELNRSGYCSLAAASQATPMQVGITLNPLIANGALYIVAPSSQAGQTVTLAADQMFWGMAQGSVETIHPADLGSSVQWTSSAGGQNPGANSNVAVYATPNAGWLTTLISTLRDSSNTNGAGPARVASLPTTDLTFLLDGVPLYNRVRLDMVQDKIERNFGVNLNGNAADPAQPLAAATQSPGATLTKGVVPWTWRDSVADSVLGADTLDELIRISPGTQIATSGTFGSTGTAPFSLQYVWGVLVPVNEFGLPYAHLTY